MARRRPALCLLVTALVAAPTAAQAGPKEAGDQDPYRWAAARQHVNCPTDVLCQVTSTATTAGALEGKSTYDRKDAGGDGHEAGVAWVWHDLVLAVPAGATAVTVTATWSLELAVAASSGSGTTYGAVTARLRIPQCEGSGAPCTATLIPESNERVRWLYDMPDGLYSSGRDGRQTVTLAARVEGANLPKSLTVQPDVQGAAGGYPDCVLLVPCLAGKEKPQGTSSASFSGTLDSVRLRLG